MLRKYSNSRTLEDNIKLGTLTAFTAGMVNVVSLLVFFAFTSNVTGHFAILASEIVNGNIYQVAVVFSWIFLFFLGGFVSNLIVINLTYKSQYLAHATPIFLEILCLLAVGFYGQFYYRETLFETELLLSLMLFAMGLQNGLTASISNFAVKTTHLTGATTDLGILFAMFTKKEYRDRPELVGRAKLLGYISIFYLVGGVTAGFFYLKLKFATLYIISFCLVVVLGYDLYKVRISHFFSIKRIVKSNVNLGDVNGVRDYKRNGERKIPAATT